MFVVAIVDRQKEIEAVLAQLRDVISARIVVEHNNVRAVHVVANRERPAKHIVRDVETALYARFALDIDHRLISVVQFDDPPTNSPQIRRPVFQALQVEITRETRVVQVTLQIDRHVVCGTAEGPKHPEHSGRLASLATVDALNTPLAAGDQLVFDNIVYTDIGQRRLCVVSLQYMYSGVKEQLIGGALVDKSDSMEPAVKSTLMAVNRRLRYVTE